MSSNSGLPRSQSGPGSVPVLSWCLISLNRYLSKSEDDMIFRIQFQANILGFPRGFCFY
jgi:hypothetical protein